ncbi:MAG: glycerophosphoryl diester phosphodiesterase membrane domain-containing protein [Tannerellaceae bacterium]|jgi:uncharacterized membrane protein|nr:glycerophosphoryl diester phosphodiesterase membrane domain-containing protein [Tannerellaceae bacterium]
MESKFTISEVLSASWAALKSQIWILVGLFIGYMILSFVFGLLLSPAMTSIALSLIANLIFYVIAIVFTLGYTKNLFQTLDGEEPQFSAYGQQARKIGTYFVAGLLYCILVFIGTLLLIIPGIYIALRLQFFVQLIVEEDAGIIESLQKSWNITKGQALPLFLLALVMMGICIVGFILLGVGIFVAAPLISLMCCCVFRKLNSPLNSLEEETETDVKE